MIYNTQDENQDLKNTIADKDLEIGMLNIEIEGKEQYLKNTIEYKDFEIRMLNLKIEANKAEISRLENSSESWEKSAEFWYKMYDSGEFWYKMYKEKETELQNEKNITEGI